MFRASLVAQGWIKESVCQCRRHRFDPGSGRSHMLRSNEASVPQLLSLCSRARALQEEKPPHWEAFAPQLGRSPGSPQLEKSPHRTEDPTQPKINKILKKLKFPGSHTWLNQILRLRGIFWCSIIQNQSLSYFIF